MEPVWRARLAALVIAAAAGVLFYLAYWASGIVLASAALAVLVLVTERSAPLGSVAGASAGPVEALARLAKELHLEGRGVFVPPRPGIASVRLFVPAADGVLASELPPLEDEVVVHRGPPGVVGLSLPSPAAGLEVAWKEYNGLPRGLEAAEVRTHVARSLETFGLGRGVRVESGEGKVRVVYTPTGMRELCRRTRTDWAPWGVQGGCPACALASVLVARAFHSPVRLLSAEEDDGSVRLEWEVLASGRA